MKARAIRYHATHGGIYRLMCAISHKAQKRERRAQRYSETQAARDIDGAWMDNLGESPDW